jgi:hypothetical protein
MLHRRRRRRDEARTRRTLTPSQTAVLTAVPDGRGHLSEGVIVEATVLGRVFGLRLLALDATVVVSPAAMAEPPRRDVGPPPSRAGRRPLPAARHLAIGSGLAGAARDIDRSAATLTAARDGARRGAA